MTHPRPLRDWKRERLGRSYTIGVRWRQVRVARPPEPIVVIRLAEDMKAGDELVLTRRDLRFATTGMEYEARHGR
jgi:hypothetical protein